MFILFIVRHLLKYDTMAQLRLITDERLNVIESFEEIERMMHTLEATQTGFVKLTKNVRLQSTSMDEPDTIIQEPVCVNIAHVIMYY